MSQAEFRNVADIAPSTLTKLRKDREVSMNVLIKICDAFDCNIGDIVDYTKTGESEK